MSTPRVTFLCFVCRRRVQAPRYGAPESYTPDNDPACWECSDVMPEEAREDGREYAKQLTANVSGA